jgi:hypothetical protein
MKMRINMKKSKTCRGFNLIEFEDIYGAKCSIQESSLATAHAIWFGIDDADPQIMASKIKEGGTGWVPYKIPKDVFLTTRMHLDKKQVFKIILVLLKFLIKGRI